MRRNPFSRHGWRKQDGLQFSSLAALSSYDASYVALAELIDATLITLDKRLAGAPDVRCAVATR